MSVLIAGRSSDWIASFSYCVISGERDIDGVREAGDDPGARDVLRPERAVEVGPGLDALPPPCTGCRRRARSRPGRRRRRCPRRRSRCRSPAAGRRRTTPSRARPRSRSGRRARGRPSTSRCRGGVREGRVAVRGECLARSGPCRPSSRRGRAARHAGPAAGRRRAVRQVEVVGDRRAVGHRPRARLLVNACAGAAQQKSGRNDDQELASRAAG